MKVALRLRYEETCRREPSAWFVAGSSADVWLAELAAWRTPLAAAQLFAVPTSRADRTPCGVFVLGASPEPHGAGPRTIGYARLAERLYVPLHAQCEPEVTEADLVEVLDGFSDARVWHPQAGLVVLAAEAAFSVADLLARVEVAPGRWQAAQQGVAVNSRLISLEPTDLPTVDQVMNAGRGDIATRPPKLDDLPAAPGEPRAGPLGTAQRAAERAMVRTVRKVIELLPGNAEQPTWLNSVYDWATEKLQDISQRDDDARHRELLRLMNLLKSDPDQGLRFALPFGGEAHRGLSPPSNRLGAHDVNYRLGGQGGGAPADYWDVSADMQFRLMQQYRELAAREIAIGRHRRAAYIYAHLLGDLKSAAATLADGGHYRDAAVLYEEKLNRPELAAECLRRGGLRLEAIAIYERLEKHEIVGDLYAELERPDEASGAWRRAVAAHQQASDVLAAAKLLEAKLEAADEAFRLLADAWPASSQAQSCLAEAFQTARRSRLHDLAARLVDDAAVRIGTGHAAPLADILADQASQYPDDAVRRLARERTQIVVSQRLSADIDDRETMRLVGALRKLAPNDRLLERDGHRFVGLRREARPVVKPKLSRGRLTVVDQVMLGMPCRAATSTHEAIFAAGVQEGELKVVRLGWSAPTVERPFGKSWRFSPELEQNAVLLMADPTGMNDAVIHVCGAPALPNGQLFRATDQFPKPLGIGSHRGISSATVGGLCCSNEHCTFINLEPPKFLEHTYHLLDSSRLSESSDLFEWPTDGFDLETLEMPLPIAMVAGKLHVGIGTSLCCHAAGKTTVHHLPQPAVQLVASAPGTRARLAVAMQRGGLLYWGDACGQSVPFASEMERPRIGLTRQGLLLAAGDDELDCYQTAESKLVHHGRYELPHSSPIALLTTRALNRFALVYADGRLVICEAPQ